MSKLTNNGDALTLGGIPIEPTSESEIYLINEKLTAEQSAVLERIMQGISETLESKGYSCPN